MTSIGVLTISRVKIINKVTIELALEYCTKYLRLGMRESEDTEHLNISKGINKIKV